MSGQKPFFIEPRIKAVVAQAGSEIARFALVFGGVAEKHAKGLHHTRLSVRL
jgi:hypothetical protein